MENKMESSIMENQMERNMENEVETGNILDCIGIILKAVRVTPRLGYPKYKGPHRNYRETHTRAIILTTPRTFFANDQGLTSLCFLILGESCSMLSTPHYASRAYRD